ncbi:MAG: DUF305 domain-containing protein [Rhizobiales bacterium]|nr:DUF305 domain-containing protein [Hyphomicrobiales bacterium]
MESSMGNMGEHQQAYMQAMTKTEDAMMRGIMAEDADVAFACGMMGHHQAAINMANVELQVGDAGPMKEMAQKIIDAQKQEIAELRAWIEEQAQ